MADMKFVFDGVPTEYDERGHGYLLRVDECPVGAGAVDRVHRAATPASAASMPALMRAPHVGVSSDTVSSVPSAAPRGSRSSVSSVDGSADADAASAAASASPCAAFLTAIGSGVSCIAAVSMASSG